MNLIAISIRSITVRIYLLVPCGLVFFIFISDELIPLLIIWEGIWGHKILLLKFSDISEYNSQAWRSGFLPFSNHRVKGVAMLNFERFLFLQSLVHWKRFLKIKQ